MLGVSVSDIDDYLPSQKETGFKKQELLFLSLMVLLLAFFIVLQSMSVPQLEKQEKALKSIEQTFQYDDELILIQGDNVSSQQDDKIGFPDQIKDIGDLFETKMQLVKVTKASGGNIMLIELPIDELFERDSDHLLPISQPVLNRVANALRTQQSNGFYKMDFYLMRPLRKEYSTKQRQLDIARAGKVALYMTSLNVDSSRIGIGIQIGDPSTVRFLFHQSTSLVQKSNEQRETQP